jgi:hypothetical protein
VGVLGLWKWLETKGVSPTFIILGFTEPDKQEQRKLVDLQGGYYSTIRWAYNNLEIEEAHEHLESQLLRLGRKEDIVVYIDGERAMEKKSTHDQRAEQHAQSIA